MVLTERREEVDQTGLEETEEAMETAEGAGGVGYPPEHFDGAAGATTENGKHMCHEYNKVTSEALARVQASAGPAAGEDIHGATTHRAGWTHY